MSARWLWSRNEWAAGGTLQNPTAQIDIKLPAPYNLQRVIFRGAAESHQNQFYPSGFYVPQYGIFNVRLDVIHPAGRTDTVYWSLVPPAITSVWKEPAPAGGFWGNSWAATPVIELDSESRVSYDAAFGQVHVLLSISAAIWGASWGGEDFGWSAHGQLDLLGSTTQP